MEKIEYYVRNSVEGVESVRGTKKVCVLDIDVQGVKNVKKSSLEPKYVFIAPPSKEVLEERLRGRNTETEDAIKVRLANAAAELEYGNTPNEFDHVFTNNDLETCFTEMKEIFEGWYPQLK